MPVRKKKGLSEILSKYNPTELSNGQIRMECPFRENHVGGSGMYSFFLSPDIGAYHCFSCGAKGSAVKLLTKTFGVGYFDAVELVKLGEFTTKSKIVFELDIIWDYRKPPKTFLDRGFKKSTLSHFRVGVTKSGETIIPFYVDFDVCDELRGYQQRTDGATRVVLNSKHFEKSEYIYNLDYSYDYTVLVEGYSDVFRTYQHGYNSSALLGADISSKQVQLLSKFDNVYLALDNDYAGMLATERCYHLLKNHVKNIYLIPYTTKDPGECTSKKEWDNSFFQATDYLEYTTYMTLNVEGYTEMKDKVLTELKNRRK